jgi:hypothetical protein
MTDADRGALTPLFWTHVNLYGKFDLDMSTRLDLEALLTTVRSGAQAAGEITTISEAALAGPPRRS